MEKLGLSGSDPATPSSVSSSKNLMSAYEFSEEHCCRGSRSTTASQDFSPGRRVDNADALLDQGSSSKTWI